MYNLKTKKTFKKHFRENFAGTFHFFMFQLQMFKTAKLRLFYRRNKFISDQKEQNFYVEACWAKNIYFSNFYTQSSLSNSKKRRKKPYTLYKPIFLNTKNSKFFRSGFSQKPWCTQTLIMVYLKSNKYIPSLSKYYMLF